MLPVSKDVSYAVTHDGFTEGEGNLGSWNEGP